MPTVPDELAQPFASYDEPGLAPEIIETAEADIPDFQFPGWGEEPRLTKRRRRNKVIRFIFLEALAFALLIVSTKLEVADQFSENSLTTLYKALMAVAVIAMAAIPVIFFALPPTLPPSRR